MIECRLIVDPPHEGAWNMALDEVLLRQAHADGVPTVRFYQWQEPTLSLGYFQPHSQRAQHAASQSCPVVRRASGGGAILHDRELTYSIALPHSHPLARQPQRLYCVAHQSLAQALSEVDVECRLRTQVSSASTSEPFLCFLRQAVGDLLLAGQKIAGSAQRRYRGAVLQHGSVLLRRPAFAPELPGIADLTEIPPDFNRLRTLWEPRLAAALDVEFLPGQWTTDEMDAGRHAASTKFSADLWNRRR